jgi:predicted transcriptional regulator
MAELKTNIVDAYNSYAEIKGLDEVTINEITIQLDLPQLFEFYKEINASALGSRIGMDKTLISQYINGHKKPGSKQVKKILEGIKQLGSELASLELSI